MDYFGPINNALAGFVQNQQGLALLKMKQEQNALARQLQQAQLDRFSRDEEQRGRESQAIRDLTKPVQVGGPLREGFSPVRFEQQPLTRERVFNALAQSGNPKALEFLPQDGKAELREVNGVLGFVDGGRFTPVEGAPQRSPEYQIVETDQGFQYVPKSPGQPIPTGLRGRERQTPTTNITIDSGKRQSEVVDSFLKKLPDVYQQAVSDHASIAKINSALEIVNRGGNSVTGLSGAVKAALAPYATAVGLNTQTMDDAQLLHTLLDATAGSLRMEVVGPGPVSNFEQGILQKVSGKKMSAAEGVKAILNYHKHGKEQNIRQLNKRIESAAETEGYGDILRLYPPIDIRAKQEQQPQSIQFLGFE